MIDCPYAGYYVLLGVLFAALLLWLRGLCYGLVVWIHNRPRKENNMRAKLYMIYLHITVVVTTCLIGILQISRKPIKWIMRPRP